MDNKCEAHTYQVLTDECQDRKHVSNYMQFTTDSVHGCLYLSLANQIKNNNTSVI